VSAVESPAVRPPSPPLRPLPTPPRPPRPPRPPKLLKPVFRPALRLLRLPKPPLRLARPEEIDDREAGGAVVDEFPLDEPESLDAQSRPCLHLNYHQRMFALKINAELTTYYLRTYDATNEINHVKYY
jgi:hypothetical protein